MREKVRKVLLSPRAMHAGYQLFWHRSLWCSLLQERKCAVEVDALSECTGDLHETKVHTDRMQALVEETYHTYIQFGVACHFGVSLSIFAAKVAE